MNTPNNSKQANSEASGVLGGLIAPPRVDIKMAFKIIQAFNAIPSKTLQRYVQYKTALGCRLVIKVLIMLYTGGNITAYQIKKGLCCDQNSLADILIWLVGNGMLREVGRPRLIIPFQRYKVDKAYKITAQGEMFLKRLFEDVFE